jgi:DNA repair exonuclease SbcCD ATPase subunit
MPNKENNPEVTLEVAETAAPSMDAFNAAAEDASTNTGKYTAEDIAKARQQEKSKVYGTVEKLQEELAVLKQKESEREAKDAERRAARQAREAELAAEKKKQEESELGFKDLLSKKEQEFQAQLEAERAEREKAFALLQRERDFQDLQQYRQSRVEAERNDIMPELLDLVDGNSKDEVEQSILRAKEKTAKILESVQAASLQSRKEMVGTRITSPASGPLDNDSASNSYSTGDISNMSMADYAKNRSKLLGNTNRGGQGLFGN